MNNAEAHALKLGTRYLVVYQIPGVQRYPRYSIFDLIGIKPAFGVQEAALIFSARPKAGTTEIPISWVSKWWVVEKTREIQLNKDARGLVQ